MGGEIETGDVERGETITVTQRSPRRREYELRAGDRALGGLRWRRGRRSVAEADGPGIGDLELAARQGRVVVVGGDDGDVTLATVDHRGGASIINASGRDGLRWEKGATRRHWTITERGDALLSVSASQGLLRSSVRIVVERPMPEATAVLLCLIASFLALSELQSGVDGSAAVGGIIASGAG